MLSNAQMNDLSVPLVNNRVRQAVLNPFIFLNIHKTKSQLNTQKMCWGITLQWQQGTTWAADLPFSPPAHTAPQRPPALSTAHLPSTGFHLHIFLLCSSQTLIMVLSLWCNYTLGTKLLATCMIHKGTGSCFQKLGAGIAKKKLK